MTFRSDLYLFLSCRQAEEGAGLPAHVHDEEAERFIHELEETARYEFDSVISSNIVRTGLGRVTLVCQDDDREAPATCGYQDAFLFITTYKRGNVHVLTIVVSEVEVNHTFLLDQASRNDLYVLHEEREVRFADWIADKYGLVTAGKVYSASCVSALHDEVAPYLLAAEAYHEDGAMRIASDDITRMLQRNVAQYSAYDAYLSASSLLYVLHEYPENFKDRLYIECIMVFIMELIVLQITAIGSANRITLEKLNAPQGITLQEILGLYELFAATMPLWDIRKFRYDIAQSFADKVAEAFKVDELMRVYENNRKLLEDVERIKSSISSEKESRILNAVATSLAVLQVIPLGYGIALYLLEGHPIERHQSLAILTTSSVILLSFVILRLAGRRRRR